MVFLYENVTTGHRKNCPYKNALDKELNWVEWNEILVDMSGSLLRMLYIS